MSVKNKTKISSMVSSMFGMFVKNDLKARNYWQSRFYKMAMPELDWPKNWDRLSEKEKEKRLNKCQELLLGIKRKN